MSNGSGVSRGDRNRNARLARLRALVPVGNAIVGIDLADAKQMVVVTDHDSKVLARKTFRCRAWDLGAALDWAAERAAAKGWAGVTVACEPTGHRWRQRRTRPATDWRDVSGQCPIQSRGGPRTRRCG
jgi:transposase